MSPTEKRRYRSQLRLRQAALTREAILDALETGLADPRVAEPTMARVAAEAGVSEATVYRHFPTREALFEAFGDRMAERFGLGGQAIEHVDLVPSLVPVLFAYFERNQALILAAHNAPSLRPLADTIQRRRTAMLEAVVARDRPHLAVEQRHALALLLQLTGGWPAWAWLVDRCGLEPEGAVALAAAAVQAVLDAFDRDHPSTPGSLS